MDDSPLPDPTLPLRSDVPAFTVALVMQQAAQTPDVIAIRDADGRELSYADVAGAARTIAMQLAVAGVTRGDIVAIWASRTLTLPCAMLGSWLAGAAFTVLDASSLVARSEATIAVARPAALIALDAAGPVPESLARAMDAAGCATTVRVPVHADAAWRDSAASRAVTMPELTTSDAAYVVFTSGTTGVPKGIVTGHAPLAHFIDWHARTFALDGCDRFAMLAGLAHDPLLRSIFTPLTRGGMLLVPGTATMREPHALRTFLAAHDVTVLHMTPSLGLLLAHGPATDGSAITLPRVRHVFFAGETLHRSSVRLVAAVAPHATFVNYYGTTETPQAMGFFVVTREQLSDESASNIVPVGHGIEHVQLLVVDAAGTRRGVGELGEIAVRTPFLSQGYLGMPAETAAKFVANPATHDVSDRMYLTGDHGFYLPDGAVVVQGRADRQLKVRGHRVELDEIEAAIGQQPRVAHVVVDAESRSAGAERRIIAHVAAGPEVTAQAVRSALRLRLPEYMIPSRITVMASLPLNANGKVDRVALLAAEMSGDTVDDEPSDAVAATDDAREETTQRLAAIWRAVLAVDRIAVHDSFLDIGGNSLLGLEMLLRVQQEFGRRMPTRMLIDAPTIALLAAALHNDVGDAAPSLLVRLRDGGPKLPVFWLPGGGGLSVVAFRAIAARLGEDRAVYGLEAKLDVEHPQATLSGIVREFRLAIQAVQPHGPYHLIGFSLGSYVAWELAVQLRAGGEEVAMLMVCDTALHGRSTAMDRLRLRIHRARSNINAPRQSSSALVPLAGYLTRRLRMTLTRTLSTERDVGAPDSAFEIIRKRNIAAVHEYAASPLPVFDGHVTCILATKTSMHGAPHQIDPRLAWRHTATRGISVHPVAGSHLSMLDEPDVDAFATVVRHCLARCGT